jgi:hypothetical protein
MGSTFLNCDIFQGFTAKKCLWVPKFSQSMREELTRQLCLLSEDRFLQLSRFDRSEVVTKLVRNFIGTNRQSLRERALISTHKINITVIQLL